MPFFNGFLYTVRIFDDECACVFLIAINLSIQYISVYIYICIYICVYIYIYIILFAEIFIKLRIIAQMLIVIF